MWDAICFGAGRVLFGIGCVASLVLVAVSLSRDESPHFKDSYTIDLLKRSIEENWVVITQQPGGPLLPQFNPPPKSARINERQYTRLKRVVRQFVASANWGLGRPFDYDDLESGVRKATRFNSAAFAYRNPFDNPRPEVYRTPIRTSLEVAGQRHGWRIVGRDLELFLNPDASLEESEIVWSGALVQGETLGAQNLVARQFRLTTPDGNGLRISLGSSADARENATTCRVEFLGRASAPGLESRSYRSGQYFMWQGQPFVVYEAAGISSDLVVTKKINGRLTRLNLLGAATNNLIGARWRGETPYLEGALKHEEVGEVTLTIDPDLQSGAFFMLRQMLDKVNGVYGIGRPRRGSVAIIDERSGAIRALVGYPSYDTDGTESRRVLLKEDRVPPNPAFDPHMAGSTVKVMTVALGYLLYGQALADLLPTSNNDKAMRQAFQDVYGVALNPPALGDKKQVMPAARDRFNEVGGADNVQETCLEALRRIFLVSPFIEPRTEREMIISSTVEHFFKPDHLGDCNPYRSHWPVKNTKNDDEGKEGKEDVERFKRYALGTDEARFTTLRLASILGYAGSGRVLRPFLVEVITGHDGRAEHGGAGAVEEVSLPSDGFQQHRANMVGGMRPNLEAVLLPGGTGHFFIRDPNNPDKSRALYLAQDDPDTPSFNEGQRAHRDYGKTGTADYGRGAEQFQDSLFVYHHGDYLIATWLEQSDKGSEVAEDEKFWLRHPAHILTYRLVQLIEALEPRPRTTAAP